MGIIETPTDSPATQAIHDHEILEQGFVWDHTRVMSLNPEAYSAWRQMLGAISSGLGMRRFELVTLAAAAGTRSRHCRLAHGAKSLKLFTPEQLLLIALDYHRAGLPEAEVLMMDFAYRIGTDPTEITDADTLALRDAGFSDREIVDIALAAAARNYYSRAIQALGVEVEVPAVLDAELAEALVRGL